MSARLIVEGGDPRAEVQRAAVAPRACLGCTERRLPTLDALADVLAENLAQANGLANGSAEPELRNNLRSAAALGHLEVPVGIVIGELLGLCWSCSSELRYELEKATTAEAAKAAVERARELARKRGAR
jgi:hypothetical protein